MPPFGQDLAKEVNLATKGYFSSYPHYKEDEGTVQFDNKNRRFLLKASVKPGLDDLWEDGTELQRAMSFLLEGQECERSGDDWIGKLFFEESLRLFESAHEYGDERMRAVFYYQALLDKLGLSAEASKIAQDFRMTELKEQSPALRIHRAQQQQVRNINRNYPSALDDVNRARGPRDIIIPHSMPVLEPQKVRQNSFTN